MLQNLLAKIRPSSRVPLPAGCEHVKSRMLPYLDRELPSAERKIVESHLESCSACRAEMAAFRRTEAMLGAAGAAIASPGDLRPEFYARLERSRRRTSTARWLLAAPALVGAALMVVFVRGNFAHRPAVSHGEIAVTPGQKSTTHNLRVNPSDNLQVRTLVDSPVRKGAAGSDSGSRLVRKPHNVSSGRQVAMRGTPPHKTILRESKILVPRPDTRIVASLTAAPAASYSDATLGRRALTLRVEEALPLHAGEETKSDDTNVLSYRESGRPVLASLVTELHVSDEERDFMSSTRVGATNSHKERGEMLGVDGDNDNSEMPVELPALP